jgi:hypothetical protein
MLDYAGAGNPCFHRMVSSLLVRFVYTSVLRLHSVFGLSLMCAEQRRFGWVWSIHCLCYWVNVLVRIYIPIGRSCTLPPMNRPPNLQFDASTVAQIVPVNEGSIQYDLSVLVPSSLLICARMKISRLRRVTLKDVGFPTGTLSLSYRVP